MADSPTKYIIGAWVMVWGLTLLIVWLTNPASLYKSNTAPTFRQNETLHNSTHNNTGKTSGERPGAQNADSFAIISRQTLVGTRNTTSSTPLTRPPLWSMSKDIAGTHVLNAFANPQKRRPLNRSQVRPQPRPSPTTRRTTRKPTPPTTRPPTTSTTQKPTPPSTRPPTTATTKKPTTPSTRTTTKSTTTATPKSTSRSSTSTKSTTPTPQSTHLPTTSTHLPTTSTTKQPPDTPIRNSTQILPPTRRNESSMNQTNPSFSPNSGPGTPTETTAAHTDPDKSTTNNVDEEAAPDQLTAHENPTSTSTLPLYKSGGSGKSSPSASELLPPNSSSFSSTHQMVNSSATPLTPLAKPGVTATLPNHPTPPFNPLPAKTPVTSSSNPSTPSFNPFPAKSPLTPSIPNPKATVSKWKDNLLTIIGSIVGGIITVAGAAAEICRRKRRRTAKSAATSQEDTSNALYKSGTIIINNPPTPPTATTP